MMQLCSPQYIQISAPYLKGDINDEKAEQAVLTLVIAFFSSTLICFLFSKTFW